MKYVNYLDVPISVNGVVISPEDIKLKVDMYYPAVRVLDGIKTHLYSNHVGSILNLPCKSNDKIYVVSQKIYDRLVFLDIRKDVVTPDMDFSIMGDDGVLKIEGFLRIYIENDYTEDEKVTPQFGTFKLTEDAFLYCTSRYEKVK